MRRLCAWLFVVACCWGCGSEPDDLSNEDPADEPGSPSSGGSLEPPPETCESDVALADVANPTSVVGDGAPASCTQEAFRAAVESGGVITFDCGEEPVVITLTSEQLITEDTVIDGGGLVTLSGGGTTRILAMRGDFQATTPHLVVQNLRFVDGQGRGEHVEGGGGAIFFEGGRVTVIDCHFDSNRCVEQGEDVAGGAIYALGLGELVVSGSTFTRNAGSSGGAIGALAAGIEIINSTFHENRATGSPDASGGGAGGAVYMDGQGRTLSVCGSTFTANESGALGGAMFRTGYESEPNPIHLSTFDGNRALDNEIDSSAGALYLQGVHVVLTGSTISNNRARSGAGIRIESHGPGATGRLDMTNCTITGNSTYEHEDFTMRGVGAGIGMGDGTGGSIRNCTIVANSSQFGSGIWNASPLTITNSIIANHADNEWTPLNCTGSSYASPPAAGENNIQWPNGASEDDMDCTPGILRSDPRVGELADHGGPTQTIMPLSDSPVIGMGRDCPETDQRGQPRDRERCTIGAVEFE